MTATTSQPIEAGTAGPLAAVPVNGVAVPDARTLRRIARAEQQRLSADADVERRARAARLDLELRERRREAARREREAETAAKRARVERRRQRRAVRRARLRAAAPRWADGALFVLPIMFPMAVACTPDTLTALAAAADDTQVVQQSALFTVAGGAPGSAARMVCDGAALLQSRWSLAREIPRLRAQAAQARGGHARWPRLAHCTGHGLFVRGDCWHRFGGLPTATMNEDLAFGYQLSAAGVPIDVLPLLEVADSPATIRTLVRQHRQWFFSYPGYRDAARLAAAAEHGDRAGRAWLSAQGMARGVLSLGQSPALLATLVLPAVARRRRHHRADPQQATVRSGRLGRPTA